MEGIDFRQFPGIEAGYFVSPDNKMIRLHDWQEITDLSAKRDCERLGTDFGFLDLRITPAKLNLPSTCQLLEIPLERTEDLRSAIMKQILEVLNNSVVINIC